MPITKCNLINDTAISSGTQRESVKIVVEQFFDVIKDFIQDELSLEIRGFGTFSPKNCNPRKARNLQTGELISITVRKSISFKFSSILKNKVSKHKVVASELVKVRKFEETIV